jgi:murein DD-endopeptidase MepM/ murein hydrolase activator NlpD
MKNRFFADLFKNPVRPFRTAFLLVFFLLANFTPAEEVIHIIQKGETIYSIAHSYGVKPDEVLNLNNINDARTVQAGQKIRIPMSGGGNVPGYDEYRVEKDDTLYSLARRYGISLADLLDMNGFIPGYTLKAGEKIRVPALSGNRQGAKLAVSPATAAPAPSAASAATSPPPAPSSNKGSTAGNSPEAVRDSPAIPSSPSATAALEKANVQWPVKARDISYLTGGLYGVQITGEQREPVKSLTRGTVISTGPFRGFGNVAIIQKPDGYLYVYGGCETLSVKEGDKVAPGTELGKLGIDAKTAKPQLFFLVYMGNTPVDPVKAPRA